MILLLRSWRSTGIIASAFLFGLLKPACAFISSEYSLDTEFLGNTFFDGWDFFTDADPTLGFVSYYNQLAAQQAGLVRIPSGTDPVYIGVDHANTLSSSGPGRSSVRITSKKNWTHGLFIGDFNHIPAGVCGTWPAFWTLGPNWPFTGEIDILEGVNDIETNSISLHTNETCVLTGNTDFQSGVQGGTDCAVYPGQNVGCGVVDRNTDSYSNFNNVGGGVYAMQWTSDYIRVWFWARNAVPSDVIAKNPKPYTWGKPVANMESPNCLIDKHFQQHNIVIDTTFCGTYAGSVWPGSACQAKTGYNDCNSYVAANPQAFTDSYWSINSIRVYQLINPAGPSLPVSVTSALNSIFGATVPLTETYVPPTETLTVVSDGSIATITTKGGVLPTHPVFNTTSVDSNSIGRGMGTFSDLKPTNVRSRSTTAISSQTVPSANASTELLVRASITAEFKYVGCRGMNGKTQGYVLAETSADMSVQRCLKECEGDFFAGVFGQYCFCGSEASETEGLVEYPSERCNVPCPGDHQQLCGGIILPGDIDVDAVVSRSASKQKRQVAYPPGSVILFAVYNKIDPSINGSTSTTTKTSTVTYTETSTITVSSTNPTHSPDVILASTSQTIHYKITATNTATSYAISTTWYDYCAICPDYRTIKSTTITVLHCGYTAQPNEYGSMTPVPIPTIPMMTRARDCLYGEGGAASTTIVTIPCTSGIASLQSNLANSPTALPGVFMQDASSGASAQTVLGPSSTTTPCSPSRNTVTQTLTLQSMRISGGRFYPTEALSSVEQNDRIIGPIIPIPVPLSGSFVSIHNVSDSNIYNVPLLSRPRPTSSSSSISTDTGMGTASSTSGAAIPATSMARSAGTKTQMERDDGILGYILLGLNLLAIRGMLIL